MGKSGNRWTAAFAGKILDEADRAKNDRVYAKAHGINEHRLWWWRRRLDRSRRRLARAKKGRHPVAFVEVASKQSTFGSPLEVLLRNGRQFRISDQTDAKIVGRLAAALEGPC